MNEEKVVTSGAAEEPPVYARRRRSVPGKAPSEDRNNKTGRSDGGEVLALSTEDTPLVLINEVSKLFINKMRDHNETNISGSYRHLIYHLAKQDGRTQLELAHLTHLKPPTVSLSLAKLEEGGYIRREANPFDLRQTRVYLTDKGRQIDDEARATFQSFEKEAISGLTDDECETLIALLKKVREKI